MKATAKLSNGDEWVIKNNKAGYQFAYAAVSTCGRAGGGYSKTREGAMKAAERDCSKLTKLYKDEGIKWMPEVVELTHG